MNLEDKVRKLEGDLLMLKYEFAVLKRRLAQENQISNSSQPDGNGSSGAGSNASGSMMANNGSPISTRTLIV